MYLRVSKKKVDIALAAAAHAISAFLKKNKIGPQCALVWDFIDKVVARDFERKQNCRSP